MSTLSLTQATAIADAALQRARELDLRPMTVTVLDPGGHAVVLKREDGSGILRPNIAHAKAWGTLGMGRGGAALAHHVGVSGDRPDQDEECAVFGVRAAGLVAESE